MPYPFAPSLTYGEFKARLGSEFGCTFEKLEGRIVDQDGDEHDVYYFSRDVSGEIFTASAPDLSNDTMLLFSVIRSICARLRIPPESFGLDLG